MRGRLRRELRIERMERAGHPLDWRPFEITPRGIRLLEASAGFRKART